MTSSITRVFCFSWPTLRNAHCGRHPQGLLTALSSILENPSENPSHTHTQKKRKTCKKNFFFFFFLIIFGILWTKRGIPERWRKNGKDSHSYLSFYFFSFSFFWNLWHVIVGQGHVRRISRMLGESPNRHRLIGDQPDPIGLMGLIWTNRFTSSTSPEKIISAGTPKKFQKVRKKNTVKLGTDVAKAALQLQIGENSVYVDRIFSKHKTRFFIFKK